jgi:predicted small lipoprotein YifL
MLQAFHRTDASMSSFRRICILAAVAAMAGCGLKGPLSLPDKASNVTVVSPAPATPTAPPDAKNTVTPPSPQAQKNSSGTTGGAAGQTTGQGPSPAAQPAAPESAPPRSQPQE